MLLAALTTAAQAQTAPAVAFPVKAIRVVVPSTPGGGTDTLARLLAPRLNELLRQIILVDNRPGASTNLGTELVARAAPDGYTVLMASTPHVINPSLFRKLQFDPVNDFTAISQLAITNTVLLAHPSLPVKNVQDLITLAKARPGQLTAGTASGTSQFLAVEMFKSMARVEVLNIPYKSAGLALNDVIAGHVQFQVNTLLASLPFIQSGRLRALGVCGSMRARALPNVPTVGDTLKGFESAGWYALLGPAGLPREVTNKLYEAFAAALKSPDMARRLGDQGADVIAGTPDDLARLLPREVARWAAVVKAAGSKAD